eukprot:4765756-Ditylum_brightwellii.AAC.1
MLLSANFIIFAHVFRSILITQKKAYILTQTQVVRVKKFKMTWVKHNSSLNKQCILSLTEDESLQDDEKSVSSADSDDENKVSIAVVNV